MTFLNFNIDSRISLCSKAQYVRSGKVRLLRTSGKFGHAFGNSGNPDEMAPYEPSHQDFNCLLS